MIRLSDAARELVWHPFPTAPDAVVYLNAATTLDVDLAQSAAEEMARQLVSGGVVMSDLGLTRRHSDNFIQQILAARDNPNASNKIYERFLLGVALAEICMTGVENIEAPDGSKFDTKNRGHLAALLRDPSRCAEWRGWVLAPEIMETEAGNVSSVGPNGSSGSAETSAADAAHSTSSAQTAKADTTPTDKKNAQDKPKDQEPSKKPSSGASPKSPAHGQEAETD